MSAGASALKNVEPLRYTSIRLLGDLVELASSTGNLRRIPFGAEARVTASPLIIALDGALWVRPRAARREREVRGSGREREVPEPRREREVPGPLDTLLRKGDVYWTGPFSAEANLRVTATQPGGSLFLAFPFDLLAGATRASFVLGKKLANVAPGLTPGKAHTIWVSADAGSTAPLEALTHLLAASIAKQFRESVAVVLLGAAGVTLSLWNRDHFEPVQFNPPDPADETHVVLALNQHTSPAQPAFYHILFVNPSSPNDMPRPFASQQFHRIVRLVATVPTAIPSDLMGRLKPEARDPSRPSDAYFSSFIPSVAVKPAGRAESRPSAAPSSFFRALWQAALRRVTEPERFEGEELEDGVDPAASIMPMSAPARLRRDLCRLALDIDAVDRLWRTWPLTSKPSFAAAALAPEQPFKSTAYRWARAVTNRRVGVALSGGGAASYRAVPLIRAFHRDKVPIDVFSAISGGALLGAYYCRHGLDGLRRYVGRGKLYNRLNYLAILSSWLLEAAVDWDTGPTEIDQLEIRFVPLTTALPEDGPPHASAVVRGTLGEGVRASGAAPGFYARTAKLRTLYSDGSSATPLPARAVADYGADLVFACNAIPGPDARNPLSGCPGGKFLYDCTPVGRLLDAWVAGAFMLERISQQAAADAHVFVEATPVRAPLLECLRFDRAKHFVTMATNDPLLVQGAAACAAHWQTFKVL